MTMKKLITVVAFILASYPALAQSLTPAQKDSDFRYLASLYSTYYAPLEWKNQLFGFNALNLKPWLDRVAMTTTDLDFYELCVEYVASLNDTHDSFILPSDFVATLGFGFKISPSTPRKETKFRRVASPHNASPLDPNHACPMRASWGRLRPCSSAGRAAISKLIPSRGSRPARQLASVPYLCPNSSIRSVLQPCYLPKWTTWRSWNARDFPAYCGPKIWESWDT